MAGLSTDDAYFAGISEAKKDEAILSQKHAIMETSSEEELDGIHDGLEFPTEEEKKTLRRVPDKLPLNTYLIATVEAAERFSYYGCSVVFTNFIQWPRPDGSRTGAGGTNRQAGALGMGQQASSGLTTFYQFWVYIIPLFGAYVADTYWGRYKTITVSLGITLIGHVLLIISAIPSVLDSAHGALACFIIAMIIMGIGTGGFKSNISPLVAEQYKRTKLFIRTEKNGERVIVDPTLTVSRMYMWFYFFINIGALIGQIAMVYAEKYVGFWLSYTLPTIVFLLCPAIIFYGRNRYQRSPPSGSVLSSSLHIFFFAAKGKWSLNPVTTWRRMSAPGFWDSAKPSNVTGPKPSWMTYDDVWVDEVMRGFKACAVFLWFPIYWLTYNQINNNLTSQAALLATHGVPNDVLSNLDPFALLIFIPICDIFIYPALRRAGINFSALKKITAGFFAGSAAMIWAAVVQAYIYRTSPCGYQANSCFDAEKNLRTSPLNVWIQTGSYVLIAFSEIFASITGLEYAFTKAPKNMRSLVMAVFLFTSAISSALSEAFNPLLVDTLLIWNYGSMAVLAGVCGVIFWFSVRHIDAREDELNALATGHAGTSKDRVPTQSEKETA